MTDARMPPDQQNPVAPSTSWRLSAACLGSPLFFSGRRDEVAAAIDVCRTCPVKTQCGDYAHRTRPYVGVWAGKRYGRIR